MAALLAVDVGCTTVVAAVGDPPRMLAFDDEDGPAGTLAASLTWAAGGRARVGIDADRALDADPHHGVRGPLAHLESGSSTLELAPGPVPVVALVAELLGRPLRVAARELGAAPERAVLTIPSGWAADGRRARALRAAAALAGLPPVELVAAAIAAAELLRDGDAEVLLVCDVGGRTAQLSLVDLRDGPGRLEATTELVVGADLFDELLYHELLRELAADHPEAARQLEELHLQAGGSSRDREAARWAACQAELARAVRHCREALTGADAHAVAIGAPVGVTLELTARRARDLLASELQVLAAAAREQLALADLGGARVSAVLVGGGALTPGLREALQDELDLPVAVADEPVTAVARGALLAAAAPPAPVPERPAHRPPPAPRRPAPFAQTVRTVLEDVVAATTSGDDVVAVVRHDAHHRVVRIDLDGRVGAAHTAGGGEIDAVTATPAAVVVSGPAEATVFSADLRPITTIARPLLAAASGATAWVLSAGDEQAPVLTLTTLAVAGREAEVVAAGRVGLAAPPAAGRLPRRAARPAPPPPHAHVAGKRLRFAVPARGRGGSAAQRVGDAGPGGLGAVATRTGPGWLTAQAPAGDRLLTVSDGGAPVLALDGAELASWPAGVRVRLAAHAAQGPWIVAARRARWEALRLAGDETVAVRTGDGAVEAVLAQDDGLWLVCESGGERRLVRVGPGGELDRLAALGAPLEPIGRAGDEILVLAGVRGAPRTLVAITPG